MCILGGLGAPEAFQGISQGFKWVAWGFRGLQKVLELFRGFLEHIRLSQGVSEAFYWVSGDIRGVL